ncbi:hypothetical protein B0H17DRAFT_1177161 [Mycena rosella]|uniref:Uncharacterized protein n=1 Tax=Mycena rosella TaxID=1033263 RepID=A0AAD7GPD7_MYCRO|nr:hypothetical protein B0H17DRAFT_1177161 [Mycena rosella]
MSESSALDLDMDVACPDPLEKIFQQVEAQNERRAQQAEGDDSVPNSIARVESSDNLRRSRRRGSISITRFGQLSSGDHVSEGSSGPMTPGLSDIASKSPFYQAQLRSNNNSQTSFASDGSGTDAAHDQEDHHVTHMHTIAPRQSISRAVGGFFPRRLSRARSSVLPTGGDGAGLVIDVSVAAATVELPDNAELAATVVHAPGGLRSKASKSSIATSPDAKDSSWAARAKKLTSRFRRKRPTTAPTTDPTA